jgi:hypothetical protein
MSDSRLGTPVELPWWTIPLGLPPAVIAVAAIIVGAPLWAHLLAIASSLLLLTTLVAVDTRVPSRGMQSVWISAAYAIWVFTVISWVVIAATTKTCNCA